MWGAGFRRVTASSMVTSRAALVYGVTVLASVTGGAVTLYNGLDETSGERGPTIEGEANITRIVSFPEPLRFERGVYVVVGANVDETFIAFNPFDVQEWFDWQKMGGAGYREGAR